MPEDISSLEIDCSQVKQKLDAEEKITLIDCREPDEYELVRIDGAWLLPMSQLAERVGELNDYRDKELIVYCHHGQRSLHVARWLAGQGIANVKSMTGGIDQWSLEIDQSLPRY